jgi:hypothetical protein
MTFLETLQSHKGSLIRLRTQLFWYDGRGYDNTPGRICLLLDADPERAAALYADATATAAVTASARRTAAFLLIDGHPHWVCVAEKDIELLVNDQPIS